MGIRLIRYYSFPVHWDRCLRIFRSIIFILKYVFGLLCVPTVISKVNRNIFICHLTNIDTVDVIVVAWVTVVPSALDHRHTHTFLFIGINILFIVTIDSWNHLSLSITGKHEFSGKFLFFANNLIISSFFELLNPICVSQSIESILT